MESLFLDNITASYENTSTYTLKNINLSIKENEIVALVGESGSGKSTILKSIISPIVRDLKILAGNVYLNNNSIKNIKKNEIKEVIGKNISIILQEPGGTLNPLRKIKYQFIDSILRFFEVNKNSAYKIAFDLLKELNFSSPEKILDGYPFELSGGMKQRVAIALAMLSNPKFLLADEPTCSLDPTTQYIVINKLIELRNKYKTGILIVTHDIALANYISDKIGVVYEGRIIEFGEKNDIINSPENEYTKLLIESIPRFKKRGNYEK